MKIVVKVVTVNERIPTVTPGLYRFKIRDQWFGINMPWWRPAFGNRLFSHAEMVQKVKDLTGVKGIKIVC